MICNRDGTIRKRSSQTQLISCRQFIPFKTKGQIHGVSLPQPPKGLEVGLAHKQRRACLSVFEWNWWGNLASAKPGLGLSQLMFMLSLLWARLKHWTKRKLFSGLTLKADSPQEQPRASSGTRDRVGACKDKSWWKGCCCGSRQLFHHFIHRVSPCPQCLLLSLQTQL